MPFFPAAEQPPGSTKTLLRESDGTTVRRTVLPSGLRVLSEAVPGARSVTLGVWAGVGSRDETDHSRGAAHFLEHLLFKGTERRSALQIASEIDAVGGMANAFTSKEFTCFYAKTLGRDLSVAVDVMLDMTSQPTLADEDIDAERTVVVEEIGMHEDDPGDRAGEALEQQILAGSSLGRPILGTRESIANMQPAAIRSFFRRHYRPDRLALTVAGDVDHRQLVSMVRRSTRELGWPEARPRPLHRNQSLRRRRQRSGQLSWQNWPGEQCTVAMAVPGLPRAHPDCVALDVLNEIIGGGMSSRLFQSVRERHGLAYAVQSGHSAYTDAGLWSAAAGCQPDRAADVVELIMAEIGAVLADGISPEELERARGHLAGSLVLAGEDTSSRMATLGRAEVATGELLTLTQARDRIDSVTSADLNRVAQMVLAAPFTTTVIGGPKRKRDRQRIEKLSAGGSR